MAQLAALYPRVVRGQNLFLLDGNLQSHLARTLPAAFTRLRPLLESFGAWVGTEADEEAEYTDRFAPPALEAYDREGALVNRVRVNPLWEAASREAYARGMVGLSFASEPAPFALTFAMGYLLSQANVSLHCPVTMTGAVAYVLDRFAPAPVKARYLPPLIAMDGAAHTAGTWATERHGGSDVGRTTTRAEQAGDHVRLTGLKWFTSNAGGEVALATARPDGAPEGTKGLGVYLVPARLPDGRLNTFRIRKLKDKLGTTGIATAEIELDATYAEEVAPPPQGFKLMMEALEFSRIHNAMAGAGVARRALLEAIGYAREREAFGQVITRYPMVQDEILSILVACEAGFALAMEAAHAFDAAHRLDLDSEAPERVWLRLVTALAKYMTAEDAIKSAQRALEIIGGNGYTQDYVTARLVRDAQVLTVWEGPANIQALELLRLLGNRLGGRALIRARVSKALESAPEALMPLVQALRGEQSELEAALDHMSADAAEAERHARRLLAFMADLLAAVLLLEEASAAAKSNDYRKAAVLRLFIDERLRPPARRGIAPGRAWTSMLFEPIVGYAPLSRRDVMS
jgi:alkylation response protein AidB-like acyl-CoA dehydrogenase